MEKVNKRLWLPGICGIRFKPVWHKYVLQYSQTCIKRSWPLGQRKCGLVRQGPLKRGSIQMKFSMTGQEKCDLLIQLTA